MRGFGGLGLNARRRKTKGVGGWIKYVGNPVLDVGPEGSWDGHYVRDPWIIYEDGEYRMWYWGNRAIGYAASRDGIHWKKYEGNPIFDNAGRPCVVHKHGAYCLYYNRWPVVGLATSSNPQGSFVDHGTVLEGKAGWEKGKLWCTSVLFDADESIWKMWYSGGEVGVETWTEPEAIGYAISRDGIRWRKYENNPIISPPHDASWLSKGICSLNVVKRDGHYYGVFNAISDDEVSRIGRAESEDATTWSLKPSDLIIDLGNAGEFDADHCFRPFELYHDGWKLWYNGRRDRYERLGYAYPRER